MWIWGRGSRALLCKRSEIGAADSVAANERSELISLYAALSVRQNQCSDSLQINIRIRFNAKLLL